MRSSTSIEEIEIFYLFKEATQKKVELPKNKYELSNHLGNVLVTTSDLRKGTDNNADGIADYYNAIVTSANDYFAFGSLMAGRQYNSTEYKYGVNGMIKDDEVLGHGNSYTTEFRELDTRIGRWWGTDPVTHHFQSPFCAFDNSPIIIIDPSGADGGFIKDECGNNTGVWVGDVVDKKGNEYSNQTCTSQELQDYGYMPVHNTIIVNGNITKADNKIDRNGNWGSKGGTEYGTSMPARDPETTGYYGDDAGTGGGIRERSNTKDYDKYKRLYTSWINFFKDLIKGPGKPIVVTPDTKKTETIKKVINKLDVPTVEAPPSPTIPTEGDIRELNKENMPRSEKDLKHPYKQYKKGTRLYSEFNGLTYIVETDSTSFVNHDSRLPNHDTLGTDINPLYRK